MMLLLENTRPRRDGLQLARVRTSAGDDNKKLLRGDVVLWPRLRPSVREKSEHHSIQV